jgi:uncharacterized lipoprotein YddW (UPF0748 family)
MRVKNLLTQQAVCYFGTEKPIEIKEPLTAQPFAAMWVSNVVNIDLPVFDDIGVYQKKIVEMLDVAQAYRLSAIFFQVRTTNDAFYASKLNPYSRYFTGVEGKQPPFDILPWIIEKTHERGIEFHAWCNPYRVSVNGALSKEQYLETCDNLNFAKRHPEFILKAKDGKLILNPARAEVKSFIIDSMIELAQHYDIDGIHFDDYFYPYGEIDEENADLNEYAKRTDQHQSLGDFRRDQVTDVIDGVHKALQKTNSKLRFGISPFGIWKNRASDPLGSNTDPRCSQTYFHQFADSRKWVVEKMVDYVVPQIYWPFSHHLAPFADLCDWWSELCDTHGIDLYIGHGAYRLGREGFGTQDEMLWQVAYAASRKAVKGHVFFTYNTFREPKDGLEGMTKLKQLLKERDL